MRETIEIIAGILGVILTVWGGTKINRWLERIEAVEKEQAAMKATSAASRAEVLWHHQRGEVHRDPVRDDSILNGLRDDIRALGQKLDDFILAWRQNGHAK